MSAIAFVAAHMALPDDEEGPYAQKDGAAKPPYPLGRRAGTPDPYAWEDIRVGKPDQVVGGVPMPHAER